MSREDVFIANVLKSRPPGNRDPQPEEIEACRPYLFDQVRLIEPKVVCTLGNFATKLLSGNPAGITRVRGTPQVHELGGRAVFLLPLFHPAAGAAHSGGEGDAARRLRDPPEAARRARPPAPPTPRRRSRRRPGPGAAAAPRRPARLLWLSREREPDALRGRRREATRRPARRRRLRPATSSSSSVRSGPGKTTLIRGACRALGVEEPVTSPDLHDRPALPRPGARLPPRPLPARRPRGGGTGAPRGLPRRRDRRLRRVARGRRAAPRRGRQARGSARPRWAGIAARSRSTGGAASTRK